MDDYFPERRWLCVTLILSSITIVCLVFAAWELIENRFFRDLDVEMMGGTGPPSGPYW